MSMVEDGKERYIKANQPEVYARYEKRVAEIKDFYAVSAPSNVLKRWLQRVLMQRDTARAKREIYGDDNFYLTLGDQLKRLTVDIKKNLQAYFFSE